MSPLFKREYVRALQIKKSSGTLSRSVLKLFTVFTKAGGAFCANQATEHHL
jgi:hypothetical protein